jgi:hypothetical protein
MTGILKNDTTIILIKTLLIVTLHIMAILLILNMDDITYI